jgi:uncharacterized membrane protein (GlpM family)
MKRFILDFLIGGFMVAASLLVAATLSPIAGGIIAGLPIRMGTTLAIVGYREGGEKLQKTARGALVGMIGSLGFTLTLYFTLLLLSFMVSFVLSLSICMGIIIGITLTSRIISPE